jgi:putative PIN family toxin of toxin-antitoxin system
VLRTADLYVSPDLLAEYREVPKQLRSSGKLTADQRRALVSGIATFVSEARVVVPTKPVALCRDPDDDMVLECCRAARASVLITGDRDLLELATKVPQIAGLRRLAILAPRAFVERTTRRGTKKR